MFHDVIHRCFLICMIVIFDILYSSQILLEPVVCVHFVVCDTWAEDVHKTEDFMVDRLLYDRSELFDVGAYTLCDEGCTARHRGPDRLNCILDGTVRCGFCNKPFFG